MNDMPTLSRTRPKFLLAENLNRLAKWLRMLGYDAALYKRISFDRMIRLAQQEKRIILTRCPKQANSGEKFPRILIRSGNHLAQLAELREKLEFNQDLIFSRCLNCNRILYDISPETVKSLVPDFVARNFTNFKVCRKCGKIFWTGTHYQTMFAELKRIFEN